jgi:CheY-like chemotaxis protein
MKPKKILIADDDREVRRTLEIVLQSAPFDVDYVVNAEQEVEYARQNKYDLIVSDLQMVPGDSEDKSGIEAIKAIRGFDRQTPILLHTSYDNEDIKREALEAGATDVLIKQKISLVEYQGIFEKYMS